MSPDFVPALQSVSAKGPCHGKLSLGNSRDLGQEPKRALACPFSPELEAEGGQAVHGKGSKLLAAILLPASRPLASRGWISSPTCVMTATSKLAVCTLSIIFTGLRSF